MQMKRKKLWITLSIVCASIIIVCIVLSLVFKLKTVDIEFRTRVVQAETNLPAGIKDRVLESGDFDYSKNTLFANFDKNIEKIEKENPYVKVEQVIRYFPNKVKVFISERLPRYRVQDAEDTNRWYILDSEFKVLDKVTTEEVKTKLICSGSSTYYNKTVEIDAASLKVSSHIGEFIKNSKVMKNMLEITKGIYGRTEDVAVAKSISFDKNNNFVITLKNSASATDDGCKIQVSELTDLRMRVFAAVDLYMDTIEADPTVDLLSAVITVDVNKNLNGEYIARFAQ